MSGPFDIFLSYSTAQKGDVEFLSAELADVGSQYSVFFDEDTIKHGERITPTILKHAGTCKLAVVLVSEEYFRSKYPMMELAASYTAAEAGQNKLPCLLPVFLALRPDVARDESRQSKWLRIWGKLETNEKMSGKSKTRPSQVQPTVWEKAVDRLMENKGPVYKPHENNDDSEVFLKKVAQDIVRMLDDLNRNNVSSEAQDHPGRRSKDMVLMRGDWSGGTSPSWVQDRLRLQHEEDMVLMRGDWNGGTGPSWVQDRLRLQHEEVITCEYDPKTGSIGRCIAQYYPRRRYQEEAGPSENPRVDEVDSGSDSDSGEAGMHRRNFVLPSGFNVPPAFDVV